MYLQDEEITFQYRQQENRGRLSPHDDKTLQPDGPRSNHTTHRMAITEEEEEPYEGKVEFSLYSALNSNTPVHRFVRCVSSSSSFGHTPKQVTSRLTCDVARLHLMHMALIKSSQWRAALFNKHLLTGTETISTGTTRICVFTDKLIVNSLFDSP